MNAHRRAAAALLTLAIFLGSFSTAAFAQGGSILYGIGFVNATGLNLRGQPALDAPILATASAGECVVLLDQQGSWYHVLYNLQEGYMSGEYLNAATVENAELGYGRVIGSAVNLRSGPGTSYSQVGTASLGERCYIIGLNQGWLKILSSCGACYIRSDFVELTEIPYENRASQNSPQYYRGGCAIGAVPGLAAAGTSVAAAGTSATAGSKTAQTVSTGSGVATGSAIVEKAKQYLGTPYVYGGASPAGFDCSGLVYYVYGCFGISVDRTPAGQSSAGTAVNRDNLQPGDIVLFANTGGSGITHSGIYAGGGQFIHAPNSRSCVSYADLTTGYWGEHFYCGIRVV